MEVAHDEMVDVWAAAPEPQKEGVFHAAFAVRKSRFGLAVVSLVFGAHDNAVWGQGCSVANLYQSGSVTRNPGGAENNDAGSVIS